MFNLKDEVKMPRNADQNELSHPTTSQLPMTESYFEALKSEKVALNKLKSLSTTTYGRRLIKSSKPYGLKTYNSSKGLPNYS
jgi:hypothetical protein